MRFQRFSALLLAGCLAMQSPMQIYGAQASDYKEAAETSTATVSLGDPAENESSFDMYYAEDAADMAAAVQTLDDDPSTRITVRTEQSMEAEIPEGKGVYYDGTYILQFTSEEEKDAAASSLKDNGAKVSADTILTLCGDDTAKEKNAEQTESAPAKNTETEYVVSSESANEGDTQSSTEETEIIESSEEEPAKDDVEANTEDLSQAGTSETAKEMAAEAVKPDQIADKIDTGNKEAADNGLSMETDADTAIVALIDTGVMDASYVDHEINFTDDTSVTNEHGTRMAKKILDLAAGHAKILSLKAFNNDGTATSSNIYAAVQYAMDAGADYINLSASVADDNVLDPLQNLIQKACDLGIRVVVSAGNEGKDAAKYFPGCMEDVDTAASVDTNWSVLTSSNDGTCVNWYAVSDTTSDAAAMVTGMLVRTSFEPQSDEEIRDDMQIVSASYLSKWKDENGKDQNPDSGNIEMDPDQIHVTGGAARWKTAGALATYRFDYTGAVQKWTVPETGEYYFHLFGGTGGYLTKKEADTLGLERLYVTYGRGGETDATVNLKKGDVLYLAVGGSGKVPVVSPQSVTSQSALTAQGGWNGGGSTSGNGAGSGGGATHVAYKDGLLSSLSDSDLLLVAGGGGGRGSEDDQGIGGIGAGGGESGENALERQKIIALGGTQTDGYKRGVGESASVTRGAGGGGYYGGHACSVNTYGGAGGSGYINESVVTKGYTTTRGNSYDDGYIVIEYNGKPKSSVTIDAGANGTIYGETMVTKNGTTGDKIALPKPETKESYIQFTGYQIESGDGTIASDGITFTYGTKPTRIYATYEGTTATLTVTQNEDTAYASVTAKSVSNTKVFLQGTDDLNNVWTNLAQFSLNGKVTQYPSASLRKYVVNGSTGTFTAQIAGTYKFYIAGANGGRDGNFWYGWAKQATAYGGTGASMTFSAHLNEGDVVKLYSSTKGANTSSYAKGGSGYRRGGNNTASDTTAGGGGASAIEVNGKVVAVAAGGAGSDWSMPNPAISGHISTDTSCDIAIMDDTVQSGQAGGQGGDSRVDSCAGGGAGWQGGMTRPNASIYWESNNEYCFWSSYWYSEGTDWAGSYGGKNGYDASAVSDFKLLDEKAQWAGRNNQIEIIDGNSRGLSDHFAIKLNGSLSEEATWLPVPEWVASEFGTTASSLSNTLKGNGIATVSLLQKDMEEVPADGKTKVSVKLTDTVAPGVPTGSYLSATSDDYKTQTVSFEKTEDEGGHYYFRIQNLTDAKETSYISGFKGWSYITDTQPDVSDDFVREQTKQGKTMYSDSATVTHATQQQTEYMHIAAVDHAGNVSDCVTVELPSMNSYILPATAIRIYYHSNLPGKEDEVYTDRRMIPEGENAYTVLGYSDTALDQTSGYKFMGWTENANGSGTAYAAGSSQSASAMNKKDLYAQWQEQTYNIAFEKNAADAKGVMKTLTGLRAGTETKLPANQFTREGFEFAGWSKKTTGYPQYGDKANVLDLAEPGQTATLYAIWKPAYTINVFVQDGNSSSFPSKANYVYTGYEMPGDQVNADTKIKDLALDGYTLVKTTNAAGQAVSSTALQVTDTPKNNVINLYYKGSAGLVYYSLKTGSTEYYPGELSHEWLGTAAAFSSIPASEKNGNAVTNANGIEKYLKKIPTDQVDAYLEKQGGFSSADVVWSQYKLASDGDYHVYGFVKHAEVKVIYHSNFGTDKTYEETLSASSVQDGKPGVILKNYAETGLPESYKRFQYWTENADGSGTAYGTMNATEADQKTTSFYPAYEAKTIHLYAQWDENAGFIIEKRDQETNQLIGGAEFTIYKADGTKCMDVSVGDSGKSSVFYLPKGTYRIHETKAPDGYMLAVKDMTVESKATGYQADDQKIVSFGVQDQKLNGLPSAGGNGRTKIYLAALLSGACAVVLIWKIKKKE